MSAAVDGAGGPAPRRATWAGGLAIGIATVVVLGITVWVTAGPGRAGGGAAAGASATPTATPTAAADPTPTVPVGPAPSAAPPLPAPPVPPGGRRGVRPALTAVLRAAVARVAPGLSLAAVRGVWAGGPLDPLAFVGSQGELKAWAELRDAQGPGTLFLSLDTSDYAPAKASAATFCDTPAVGMACSMRTEPNGDIVIEQQGIAAGEAVTTYAVQVIKPDGTNAFAILTNISQNDQPGGKQSHAIPQRPVPPLSVEQIVDILRTPEVSLAA